MIRTDLAIENKEIFEEKQGTGGEIPGVSLDTDQYEEGIRVTRIQVLDELGSKIMGKPEGNYITVEIPQILTTDMDRKEMAAKAVAIELKRLIPFHYHLKALVIGLGNEKITPDALGPHTISKINVTRHLFLLCQADGDDAQSCVSALNPGVMASTGMETAEVIKSAAEISDPEVVIVVDSLASRNIDRINTTVQISDTGISPGAGAGNVRKELNEKTLGRKVIAIGVPTVIDAKTMVYDALSQTLGEEQAGAHLQESELDMIVTSSEIDQVIHDFSEIIANAINITLHPGIYS